MLVIEQICIEYLLCASSEGLSRGLQRRCTGEAGHMVEGATLSGGELGDGGRGASTGTVVGRGNSPLKANEQKELGEF